MEIYVHFIEYEIIHLVTTSKYVLLASINKIGGFNNGDFVEVWKDNVKIAYYDNMSIMENLEERSSKINKQCGCQ